MRQSEIESRKRWDNGVFGLAGWYRDGTLAERVAIEARNLAPPPSPARGIGTSPLAQTSVGGAKLRPAPSYWERCTVRSHGGVGSRAGGRPGPRLVTSTSSSSGIVPAAGCDGSADHLVVSTDVLSPSLSAGLIVQAARAIRT